MATGHESDPRPASSTTAFALLTASYNSPSNPTFTHAQKLPVLKSNAPADRAVYLGTLRKATAKLQERINTELTQRMEEDKLRVVTDTKGRINSAVDEGKEEENYGEEVVEEDN